MAARAKKYVRSSHPPDDPADPPTWMVVEGTTSSSSEDDSDDDELSSSDELLRPSPVKEGIESASHVDGKVYFRKHHVHGCWKDLSSWCMLMEVI